jgi:predicted TIM-barrel fold metal-dependent hydrolase
MIIDCHGHLGNINQAPFWAADAATLERYLNEAGVDYLCVSAAKSLMYDAREGSRKLLGYVTVNPMFPESIADLDLLDSVSKFIGVKLHPDYHGYDIKSTRMQGFLDEVARRVSLVLVHVSCMPGTGLADAVRVVEFAARHPQTNFILAHLAGIYQSPLYPYFPNFAGLEKVAAFKLDNVHVDTAHYLMYAYPGVMESMVQIIGADHIIFGTDAPLQGPAQMRFAIETIAALKISDEDKHKILGGNAQKLMGINKVPQRSF